MTGIKVGLCPGSVRYQVSELKADQFLSPIPTFPVCKMMALVRKDMYKNCELLGMSITFYLENL